MTPPLPAPPLPRLISAPRAHAIVAWIKAMVLAVANGAEVYSIKTHKRIVL